MENRPATEVALDLLLYAPVGLALAARELVPQLAAKGREGLRTQTETARLIGKVATRQGYKEAERLFSQIAPFVQRPAQPSPASQPPSAGSGPLTWGSAIRTDFVQPTPDAAGPSPAARADGGDLAIPGYDTLSASQVVARLEGLSGDELEAVRAHEAAGRGRRTILTRISQLRGSSSSGDPL